MRARTHLPNISAGKRAWFILESSCPHPGTGARTGTLTSLGPGNRPPPRPGGHPATTCHTPTWAAAQLDPHVPPSLLGPPWSVHLVASSLSAHSELSAWVARTLCPPRPPPSSSLPPRGLCSCSSLCPEASPSPGWSVFPLRTLREASL